MKKFKSGQYWYFIDWIIIKTKKQLKLHVNKYVCTLKELVFSGFKREYL